MIDEIKKKFDEFYGTLSPIDKLYFGHYLIDRFIKDMETESKLFNEKTENNEQK